MLPCTGHILLSQTLEALDFWVLLIKIRRKLRILYVQSDAIISEFIFVVLILIYVLSISLRRQNILKGFGPCWTIANQYIYEPEIGNWDRRWRKFWHEQGCIKMGTIESTPSHCISSSRQRIREWLCFECGMQSSFGGRGHNFFGVFIYSYNNMNLRILKVWSRVGWSKNLTSMADPATTISSWPDNMFEVFINWIFLVIIWINK